MRGFAWGLRMSTDEYDNKYDIRCNKYYEHLKQKSREELIEIVKDFTNDELIESIRSKYGSDGRHDGWFEE